MENGYKPVVTRAQAHTLGFKKFFTGATCKHGHVADRWVTTGACVVCVRNANKKYARAYAGAWFEFAVKVPNRGIAEKVKLYAVALTAEWEAAHPAGPVAPLAFVGGALTLAEIATRSRVPGTMPPAWPDTTE